METKDYIIYKGIANAAARVFENVICPAGEYTAKDIAKEILIHFFYKDEFYNNRVQENEKITVEFDGYKCSFPIGSVFDVCAQIETAWEIPSARRAKFVRKAETRPVAVAFDVPAAAKEIIKAIPAKFDNLRPVMNYVCIDTRRRCLIAGAANVLTAVAVPNMYVSEDAKETYLIDPLLMKSGKGTIFVDEENSVNGTQTRPNYKDRNFPSWERILPAVQDAQRINITPAVWKQLKKEITAAAKFSDNAQKLVEISGRSGCPEITVNYLRIFETAGKENSRAVNINLPQPCPFDFSVQINGKQFAAVPAADSMYIYRNAQTGNVSICFAAAGAVSYLPNLDEDKDVNAAAVPAFEDAPDAAKNLLSVAAFPEIGTANSPAAAALIAAKDEETPAADSAKETRPSWEQTLPAAAVSFAFDETPAVSEDAQETAAAADSENVLPVDEETAAAAFEDAQPVPVSADRWETEYITAAVETNARAVDAPAVPVLPAGMNETLYLNICEYLKIYFDEETAGTRAAYNYIILHGVKILFGEIYLHDNKIGSVKKEFENGVCISAVPAFDIWETAQPAAVPEDAQETAANVQDETPAVFAKVDEYAVNDENGNAVIFGTYAPQIGTDEETANVETPAVQDAPDVANVPAADSVPAANDIETLINNKFAAYLNAAPADSVPAAAVQDAPDVANVPAADSVPAVDEETAPAVAVSLPVPVAAVYPLHAVYIDNVLHGVYFSKLLADEIFWNAFFTGRSVYPLQILSNETAPETESAAVLFAADSVPAVDEETAPAVQDEETAAPADSVPAADPFASVWACMQETPAVQDAPAVPVDEETPAVLFAVSEDAQKTAANVQDEEKPAVLIAANFARRFRRVWQTAAAVLFLIICAAVPVAVSDSVPADSVPAVLFAADSLANVPAVSEDEETANVQDETAPAVQDAPDVANAAPADSVPAVDEETAPAVQDEEPPAVPEDAPAAPADSVPADSVPAANSPAPAVPAVQCAPAAPVAPVAPIVIACFGN